MKAEKVGTITVTLSLKEAKAYIDEIDNISDEIISPDGVVSGVWGAIYDALHGSED